MNIIKTFAIAAAAISAFCGCLNLKSSHYTERYFVLSTLPASATNSAEIYPETHSLGIGVGTVQLPAYLRKNYFAVRRSPNEIEYLENALWAESLDQGLPRVLAGDLSSRLSAQVLLSGWRAGSVLFEVQLNVVRFDVDSDGRGSLIADWRILASGGGKLLKAGQFAASRNGPAPANNMPGAVSTLSQLAADLSAEIAQNIKSLPSSAPNAEHGSATSP